MKLINKVKTINQEGTLTMNKLLPSIFCWTKMGTEAGEELTTIIRRKEWERRLGNGHFAWGIGQSLGKNIDFATIAPLDVIFSPMRSKPKAIDVTPSEIVLWNAWITSKGQVRKLPINYFITSRAFLHSGKKKEKHYALICSSDETLTEQKKNIHISSECFYNLKSYKPLGASQITAIVHNIPSQLSNTINTADDSRKKTNKKEYLISFIAQLCSPYYVQLAKPRLLEKGELKDIEAVSSLGDIESWKNLTIYLRSKS